MATQVEITPPIVFTVPVLVDSQINLDHSDFHVPDGMIAKVAGATRFKVGQGDKTWAELPFADSDLIDRMTSLTTTVNSVLDDTIARIDTKLEEVAKKTVQRGSISAYYKVSFGGSDGRRAIFWGETAANESYILCDGGSDGFGGKVPDLRGRMILGSSSSYTAGSAGGAITHTHSLSGSVGNTTLSVAQMPSHNHIVYNKGTNCTDGSWNRGACFNGNVTTSYTGGSSAHTHSMSGSANSGGTLPPYYALAYVVFVGQ